MLDGYNNSNHNVGFSRLEKLKICSANQVKFNNRIKEINKELAAFPKAHYIFEHWIDSLPNLDNKNSFNIKEYSKLFQIQKEYKQLMEDADSNLREMKILAIDDVLDKIKLILDDKNTTT